MYFKVVNQRYPVSLVELSEFCKSDTNVPNFNPEDFKTLEFEPMEDGSMKVNYELKIESKLEPASGSLVMHPATDTMVELFQAIAYFKKVNHRDPETSSELYDLLNTDTNAPNLNPDEFDVLEFDHMEDGSLIINSELKGDPPLTTATGPILYGTSKIDAQPGK